MIRLLSIFIFLPCFLYAQSNPGFLGRKNTINADFGLFLMGANRPHGPTNEEFAYSFIPSVIRLSPRIGVSYERIIARNISLTGGLHYYTSYAANRHFFVPNEGATPTPQFFEQGSRVIPTNETHFRTVNTQLSLGFRFYSSYAPLNYYFEIGGTSIFYLSESVTFKSDNTSQNTFTFNETIEPSLRATMMGYLAFGLHEFINENIFIGFDLRTHFRTFSFMDRFSDFDEDNSIDDIEIPLSDRLASYNRFHSMVNIGLGFTISVGYVF